MTDKRHNKKTLKSMPKDLYVWAEKIRNTASNHCDLETENLHPILPTQTICELVDSATLKTDFATLIDMVRYAEGLGIGSKNQTTLDNFSALAKKIIWPWGNVIPGPHKHHRIDFANKDTQWESPESLLKASGYAHALDAALGKLNQNPNLENWTSLIDLINPKGKRNLDSQIDIIHWSDAWATHKKYQIYTRLNKQETLNARQNGRALGHGAWVVHDHPELEDMALKLDVWQKKIDDCFCTDLLELVEEMRKKIGFEYCEKWLTLHTVWRFRDANAKNGWHKGSNREKTNKGHRLRGAV